MIGFFVKLCSIQSPLHFKHLEIQSPCAKTTLLLVPGVATHLQVGHLCTRAMRVASGHSVKLWKQAIRKKENRRSLVGVFRWTCPQLGRV